MNQSNDNAAFSQLLDRVNTLEQQNKRMKRLGATLIGGSLVVALLGAATPLLCKTVWAERLVLRNASGRDVMTMDAYSSDKPTITMNDESGKSAVRLSWQEGVLMDFLDNAGKSTASVRVDSAGKTTVVRRNADGELVSMND